MLQAIDRKKTTLYRRYLGHREADERRVSAEDEITSTVLGPLEFMQPEDGVLLWWLLVTRHAQGCCRLPQGAPREMSVALWPRRRGVEPDAHLRFGWASGERVGFLVEIKWQAPLSGADQLERQWLEYIDHEERACTWHIFIAPDISEGVAAREAAPEGTWLHAGQDRLVLASWAAVRDALGSLEGGNALSRWSSLCISFLDAIGVRRFIGFSAANHALAQVADHSPFFKGLTHGFHGFSGIAPAVLEDQVSGAHFFNR